MSGILTVRTLCLTCNNECAYVVKMRTSTVTSLDASSVFNTFA